MSLYGLLGFGTKHEVGDQFMDQFTLFGIVACLTWGAIIFKLMNDQIIFLKLYRKTINPPFPLLPGETWKTFRPSSRSTIFGSFGQRILIVSKRYPGQPGLDRLAKRIHFDLLIMAVAVVAFVIAFANLNIV